MIKVVAGILLLVVAFVAIAHFGEKRNLEALQAAAMAQEQARIANERAASRQAEQVDRLQAVDAQRYSQGERQLYRCVDPSGTTSIQNSPCPATSSVTSSQAISAESPLQSSLRQQEWNRREGEARLREAEAGFAAATGTGNGSQAYYPATSARQSNSARCQSAKNARDQAYRIAGNNRSFEMIRSWNDFVYESCKGT
ncbi:MAG: DUF4124 domain-containing protein [Gammaproteobacteria bacterium]|nr:DUF4124 domain-containing protein [Gammaproteobacteria bacterium]